MSKKFMDVKRVMIPIISLVVLLSQITPSFAISSTELTDLMQTSPNVSIEVYAQAKAPSVVAYNNIVSGNFIDVTSGSWYYTDVIKAKEIGLIQGVGHGKYAPNSTITYAEFLAIVARVCDSTVEGKADGTNWYDKYIDSAKGLGVISKDEAITALKGIPRQDMIKFTCKALGVEPYTGNEVVFNDVKPSEAAYINAAYKEYLTDGIGGHAVDKSLIFGYGKTSTRAELASMALRIQEYKTDPVKYKAEKAAERAAEEKAYQQELASAEKWNGYSIPKDYTTYIAKDTDSDFFGWVFVTEPQNFSKMESILVSKFGSTTVVKQAIAYGKTKTDPDEQLDTKSFKLNSKYTLDVDSTSGNWQVNFTVAKN